MTRRVIGEDKRGVWSAVNDVRENSDSGAEVPCYLHREISVDDTSRNVMYPRYDVGDVLWVRETWGNWSYDEPGSNACYFTYFADYPEQAETFEWPEPDEFGDKIICDLPKRRPSIFMPRTAARLFLRVTDVRVERVQEITEEDARAEGCITFCDKIGDGKFDDVIEFDLTARDAFCELWDELNKKRGYGWDTNPWVWVISFERTEKPGESL
jgi:hypothetical protein